MTRSSILALALLLFCGPAYSTTNGLICPEPPPPSFGVSGYGSCPQPNVVVHSFSVAVSAPIQAEIECRYLGNGLGSCDAWPVETSTSGMLIYSTDVMLSGSSDRFTTRSFEFSCPEGDYANIDLTVANGTASDSDTTALNCVPPPAPGYVGGWSIRCPAYLPGRNEIVITPPEGAVVDHYVVEMRGVRYGGVYWQQYYSGASPNAVVSPNYESYVRVKACNLGGCGPYNPYGPNANPSLCN